MKTLRELASAYALYRGLRSDSVSRLQWAVRSYSDFIGREPYTSDLADEPVSLWLENLEQTHAPKTVYGYRVDILTLWRDAAEQGLCPQPVRVRRIKKPQPMPESWTDGELVSLLAYVRASVTGYFPGGIPRRDYCDALLRVCYDTGLRRSDVWGLTRRQVRDDGTVAIAQQKTGWPHYPMMRHETRAKFLALSGDPPLRCPYASPSTFYRWWHTVTKAAGVRHGAMQRVRRTGATHLAIEHRDQVQQYLGHRTADMVRYYIDETIARSKPVMPPPLTME